MEYGIWVNVQIFEKRYLITNKNNSMDFSQFFKINLRDLGKGVIMAILGSIVSALLVIVNTGTLPTLDEWKNVGMLGLMAGLSYLLKNLLTNSNDQFLKPETKKDPE